MGNKDFTPGMGPQKTLEWEAGIIPSRISPRSHAPQEWGAGIMFTQKHGARIGLHMNGEQGWRMAEVMVPDSP